MFIEAALTAAAVTVVSLSGALIFGNTKQLIGLQRYVVPLAVGIFLSLVLYELIPETLLAAPTYGGIVVALGFVLFYLLAGSLHRRYHHLAAEDCDRKGAAALLLVGDTVHNLADGVILGGAFLVDPALGVATAVGLALHELPQEIVEFGVLVRAGYSRSRAMLLNFISASAIIVGTLFTLALAEVGREFLWVLTGLAAGNLLYLAASDLLPRIHGNLKNYGSISTVTAWIVGGFVAMTVVITYVHGEFGHGHDHGHGHNDETGYEHDHELGEQHHEGDKTYTHDEDTHGDDYHHDDEHSETHKVKGEHLEDIPHTDAEHEI